MLLTITIAITVGIVIGGILGILKMLLKRNKYSEKQIESSKKMFKNISPYVINFAFLILIIGFVWSVYFFILGVTDRSQLEFANNVTEMLVGVLTIFSIIIAFFEFTRNRSK